MKLTVITLAMTLFASSALFAQGNGSKYGETEEQQIKCKEALQLYRTYRDQKQLDDAYKFWQRACTDCPPDVTQRLYSDGLRFIKNEIKKSEGTEREQVLIDSLMFFYDLRREYYPTTSTKPFNGYDVLGMKAVDMARFKGDDDKLVFEMFKEVVENMGVESRATYNSNYYLYLYKMYKDSEEAEQEKYLEMLYVDYLTLQENSDVAIKAADDVKDAEGYEKAKNNIDEIFIRVADCDQMVPVFKKRIEEFPDDMELHKKALRLMNMKDCTDSDFYLKIADKVCKVESTYECNYALGIGYAKKDDLRSAAEYLDQAVNMCTDCPDRELLLLKAGQVASALGQARKARGYANDILKMNPNSGEAYILIGDAIAGSASMCEDGKLGARSVYWLAVDYYVRARNLDGSLADKISKRIGKCANQFPSREELFAYTLKDGGSFNVPCWGETTTIRER